MTDREIFEMYVGMAKMQTDINRLKWAKIVEGAIGSVFQTPRSVNIFAIPTYISNISLSVASLICYP